MLVICVVSFDDRYEPKGGWKVRPATGGLRDEVSLWSVDRRCLIEMEMGGVGECEW
jgi:hypothetical protein